MAARRNEDGTLVSLRSTIPLAHGVSLDVDLVEVDGRLLPARIAIGADLADPAAPDPVAITASLWRKIAVGAVVDSAIAAHVRFLSGLDADPRASISGAGKELLDNARSSEGDGRRKRGRPPNPERNDDFYRRVAAMHKRGGRTPRKAVAQELHLSPDAAAKVIAEARRRKFLPPVDELSSPTIPTTASEA